MNLDSVGNKIFIDEVVSKFTHFKFAFILIEYFYVLMNLNLIFVICKCNLILLVRFFFFFYLFCLFFNGTVTSFPDLFGSFVITILQPNKMAAKPQILFFIWFSFTLCVLIKMHWLVEFSCFFSICLSICLWWVGGQDKGRWKG